MELRLASDVDESVPLLRGLRPAPAPAPAPAAALVVGPSPLLVSGARAYVLRTL